MPVNRRSLLTCASALPLLPAVSASLTRSASAADAPSNDSSRRIRPSDPEWPDAASWARLRDAVGGNLIQVESPFAGCMTASGSAACAELFQELKNPYFIGDAVALTQTLGWVDAWTSKPSVYAVAAHKTEDVVAAVNFARSNNLRLVVKGGGHSYQGTSNAAYSLLLWTRPMNAVTVHDAFVASGCDAAAPQPAVTIGAGAIWMQVYDAVTTGAGRYVQGGGCLTVGVAGLIQGGGFGSFSKNYGLAAAGLLEAEVVTADGSVRTANACSNPDLFWGLKGGGNSLGVITRLSLRTRDLPSHFGGIFLTVRATSDAAFRRLIGRFIGFYAETLLDPHWGEQAAFLPTNALVISMVFQGLDQPEAEAVWRPFLDWVSASPQDYSVNPAPTILAAPARYFWDPAILKMLPGVVLADDRAGAPAENVFWSANWGEAGWFLHGYESTWLPGRLLRGDQRERLAESLFNASRHWRLALHFNKGLGGAPAAEVAAATDTAINPALLDAFALAISASAGPPAVPGVPGHEPDVTSGREQASANARAMNEMRSLVTEPGSYVSESSFFEPNWQRSYWGANYPRLLAVKQKYDPTGLFFVHHGVGSEAWSADGFTRHP
jgi:FAD/FMN-containing dehydrogenase